MEVILTDQIYNLGTEGDLVKVKDGYARNYLIPKGLAFPASSANAAEIKHKKQVALDQRRHRIKTEEDMARVLKDTKLVLTAKVGEEEKLFGSITSQHIADALKKKDLNIDRRKIQIEDPIKALGSYKITVRLSTEVSAEISVDVVAE